MSHCWCKCEAGVGQCGPKVPKLKTLFNAHKNLDDASLRRGDWEAELHVIWEEIGEDKVTRSEELRLAVADAVDKAYEKAVQEAVGQRTALEEGVSEAERQLFAALGPDAECMVAPHALPLQERLDVNLSHLHQLDSQRAEGHGWLGGLVVLAELRRRIISLRTSLKLPEPENDVDIQDMLESTMEAFPNAPSHNLTRQSHKEMAPHHSVVAHHHHPTGAPHHSMGPQQQQPLAQRLEAFYSTLCSTEDAWAQQKRASDQQSAADDSRMHSARLLSPSVRPLTHSSSTSLLSSSRSFSNLRSTNPPQSATPPFSPRSQQPDRSKRISAGGRKGSVRADPFGQSSSSSSSNRSNRSSRSRQSKEKSAVRGGGWGEGWGGGRGGGSGAAALSVSEEQPLTLESLGQRILRKMDQFQQQATRRLSSPASASASAEPLPNSASGSEAGLRTNQVPRRGADGGVWERGGGWGRWGEEVGAGRQGGADVRGDEFPPVSFELPSFVRPDTPRNASLLQATVAAAASSAAGGAAAYAAAASAAGAASAATGGAASGDMRRLPASASPPLSPPSLPAPSPPPSPPSPPTFHPPAFLPPPLNLSSHQPERNGLKAPLVAALSASTAAKSGTSGASTGPRSSTVTPRALALPSFFSSSSGVPPPSSSPSAAALITRSSSPLPASLSLAEAVSFTDEAFRADGRGMREVRGEVEGVGRGTVGAAVAAARKAAGSLSAAAVTAAASARFDAAAAIAAGASGAVITPRPDAAALVAAASGAAVAAGNVGTAGAPGAAAGAASGAGGRSGGSMSRGTRARAAAAAAGGGGGWGSGGRLAVSAASPPSLLSSLPPPPPPPQQSAAAAAAAGKGGGAAAPRAEGRLQAGGGPPPPPPPSSSLKASPPPPQAESRAGGRGGARSAVLAAVATAEAAKKKKEQEEEEAQGGAAGVAAPPPPPPPPLPPGRAPTPPPPPPPRPPSLSSSHIPASFSLPNLSPSFGDPRFSAPPPPPRPPPPPSPSAQRAQAGAVAAARAGGGGESGARAGGGAGGGGGGRGEGGLRRSNRMGHLYRGLKSRVEQAIAGAQTFGEGGGGGGVGVGGGGGAGGGGGGAGGGAVRARGRPQGGGRVSIALALAEIHQNSAYFQQIEADVVKHSDAIWQAKAELEAFQTADFDELVAFRGKMEALLQDLTDETQVLQRYEGFPSSKLDMLRAAASLHSRLIALSRDLLAAVPMGGDCGGDSQATPASVAAVGACLDRCERLFDRVRKEVEAVERTREEDAKRYAAQKLPYSSGAIDRVKAAAVRLSSRLLELSAQESMKLRASVELVDGRIPVYEVTRVKAGLFLLWRCFQFAFRAYNFAGGQDEMAEELSLVVAKEMEAYPAYMWG